MLKKITLNTDAFEELKKRESDLLRWFSRATQKEKELVMSCHAILFNAKKEQVEIKNIKKYFEVKKENGANLSYLLLLYSIYICKADGFKKLYTSKDERNKILSEVQDERALRYLQKQKHTLFKVRLNKHYDDIKQWRASGYSWDTVCKRLKKYYSRYYRDFNLDKSYICRIYKELTKEKEIEIINTAVIPDIEVMPDAPDMDFDDLPKIEIMPIDS